MTHTLDINLICYNNGLNFQRTLDCLSNQTFENFKVNVIDDGSMDCTPDLVKKHAEKDPRFSYTRNDCRLYVGNFQRAFWMGDAEFVMPKSSDDLIDETYVEKCMARLKEDDDLVMVHTASEVLDEMGEVKMRYPNETNLRFLDDDPFRRALRMASTYTFAPAYWGVYRRSAVSKLAPIQNCNGFDHIVLCELALYGKVDYIDEVLFRRSRGGLSLLENAKKATLQHTRDLPIDSITSDFKYFTPSLTMILGHIEMARIARIDEVKRTIFIEKLVEILVSRYKKRIPDELGLYQKRFPGFLELLSAEQVPEISREALRISLVKHILSIEMILPDTFDLTVLKKFRRDICKDTVSS